MLSMQESDKCNKLNESIEKNEKNKGSDFLCHEGLLFFVH